MRLLYIASLDFYTKPNPSYHLMATMLEDVMENGDSVHLIGCEEEGLSEHIPENLLNNPLFTYELVKTPVVKKSDFIRRYIEGVKYSLKVKKLLKNNNEKYDVIFVQSSPTVLYTLYYAEKYSKGTKIIYNVQDMFPGSTIATGVMPQKIMQKFFYSLQKIAYKKADVITAISEDMKKKLQEQGVDEKKIQVIVNWFDDRNVKNIAREDNKFIEKYGMSDRKFYVQYAGTFGYVFDYQAVCEIASVLKSNEDIVFQMIGEGSQKENFINEAESQGLNNIQFLPLESQEMVSHVYSACSVCLIPLKKGVIGNSVPSKAGLLMACRKPIITLVDSDSLFLKEVNDNKIGFAFANEDINKAADAILKLKADSSLCRSLGENGYEYGHELYSRSSNMKKYLDLFKEMSR